MRKSAIRISSRRSKTCSKMVFILQHQPFTAVLDADVLLPNRETLGRGNRSVLLEPTFLDLLQNPFGQLLGSHVHFDILVFGLSCFRRTAYCITKPLIFQGFWGKMKGL